MDSISSNKGDEQQAETREQEAGGLLAGGNTTPPQDGGYPKSDYFERFSIQVGQVRVTDEDTNESEWLWRAEIEDEDFTCRSGTIFDAVMGVIEQATGGAV